MVSEGGTRVTESAVNGRPIVVSFTSIPPRFGRLPRKIKSIINQSVRADAIEIYIPKKYRRFPGAIPALPRLPSEVEVIEVDEDLGPATKLLPALRKWEKEKVDILVCDDDRLQDKNWISRFQEARRSRPTDIICERGWNIYDRFGFFQANLATPRAKINEGGGRNGPYRLKRALSLGLIHPDRKVYLSGGYVDVFEGFLGALIPSGSIPDTAWSIPEILWTVDDVWLSGMAKKNGVNVWAHGIPRPVYSNGYWDKVAALTNYSEKGVDRTSADRMCVEYMIRTHGVWE